VSLPYDATTHNSNNDNDNDHVVSWHNRWRANFKTFIFHFNTILNTNCSSWSKPHKYTRIEPLKLSIDILASAVRIFEIFKSNRIVTSVFNSIRNEHNYSKILNTYRHHFLTYLTEWWRFFTIATTSSNQQYQQTRSTETPTTETTIVRCHKTAEFI